MDLYAKAKAIKILEEEIIGVNLHDLVLGKAFLDMMPKYEKRTYINYTSSKLKTFVSKDVIK